MNISIVYLRNSPVAKRFFFQYSLVVTPSHLVHVGGLMSSGNNPLPSYTGRDKSPE